MYQNIYYQRSKNLIHVWDDSKGKYSFTYKKYAYKKNSNGKYTALDGTKLEKVTEWDEIDVEKGVMYESDVNPETKTLIDLYYESDDPSSNHRELFFDIEVSTEKGYSTPEEAWQPLTSVAFYDRVSKQSVVIIVDSKRKLQGLSKKHVKLEIVQTEQELISKFLDYYVEISPSILTGWNIDYYDIPYLYNRIKNVMGKDYASLLSPIGEITLNTRNNRYRIAGVSSLDYMALYKLFSAGEEPSYSLDWISQKELGKGKTKYEGSLDYLYQTDPEKFIEYNLNDVNLVVELDEKLQLLLLARGICHKGHVPYEDIYQTTRYLDGACLTYMKRLGIVAPNRPSHHSNEEDSVSDEFAGAFVKVPEPGLYEWVFDEDLAALYPSIMRTLNISPETKFGRIENFDAIKHDFWEDNYTSAVAKIKSGAKQLSVPVQELRQWLIENQRTISSIGVIYNAKSAGLIPSILVTWMQERDDYRALVKKYNKEGNSEMAIFFDGRQQAMKKVNNSLYGALGSPGFRFHDLDNAESITLTGRAVITNGTEKGSEWFTKQLGVKKDYVIYVDTDSAYMSALPIIEKMEKSMGRLLTYQEKVDITYKTSQIVEKYINDSWNEFSLKYLNSEKHFFSIKQEYVSESAFWIAKKRYAQKIISEKGVLISQITNGEKEWKLDVKGMDVVRSNFPKASREFMSNMLIDILNKVNKDVIDEKIIKYRESMKSVDILDIMLPTSIKELSKYQVKRKPGVIFTERLKGTTAHAKASLNYNDLLYYYKLDKVKPPILDGEKIKWAYLKPNNLNIDTCALKGFNDPEEIVNFIKSNIDYDKLFESTLTNKLGDFYSALKWGSIPTNSNINDFFTF